MYPGSKEETDYATSHMVHADRWSLRYWTGCCFATLQFCATGTCRAAGRSGRLATSGCWRLVAFRALTSLNDPAALLLIRQLTVSDADVSYRVAAMWFLAEPRDKEALPLLQQVLNSSREQPSVLEAAAQSHAAIISGQVPAKGVGTTVQRDTGSGVRGESLELLGLTRSR